MFTLLLFSFSAGLFSFALLSVFFPTQVLPRIQNPQLKRSLGLLGVPLLSILAWLIAWATMLTFLGEDFSPLMINDGYTFSAVILATWLFAVMSLLPYFFVKVLIFLVSKTVGHAVAKRSSIPARDYNFGKSIIEYLATGVSVAFFSLGFAFLVGVLSDVWANPQASRFFVLHAAIKNTCLYDPQKVNCPQKVSDLGIIEPREYQLADAQTEMYYEYNPANYNYTFMVRYSPRGLVIFDQRLVESVGVDFKDYRVEKVPTSDYDRVIDPPPFDGPWDQVPKWKKN